MRSRLLCRRLPNSGLPEFGTLSRLKSDKSDFGWARTRRAARWILVERSRVAQAPTYGCGKQSPAPLRCFRLLFTMNAATPTCRTGARSADLLHVAVLLMGRRPGLFLSFYRD